MGHGTWDQTRYAVRTTISCHAGQPYTCDQRYDEVIYAHNKLNLLMLRLTMVMN